MKILNVKSVTEKELFANWGFGVSSLPPGYRQTDLFVRCNKKGNVNWRKTRVYNKEYLNERGFFEVFKDKTYTEADLVDFGNYLLSDKREQSIQNKENTKKVHQEDIDNFKPKK